ncbi:hypothetical protein, partial [Escherichia coli]|uniref:hypothetical protein n=1 Tax=Escherichia coli TaxID=562 RepID=UPI00388FF57B
PLLNPVRTRKSLIDILQTQPMMFSFFTRQDLNVRPLTRIDYVYEMNDDRIFLKSKLIEASEVHCLLRFSLMLKMKTIAASVLDGSLHQVQVILLFMQPATVDIVTVREHASEDVPQYRCIHEAIEENGSF